MSFDEEVVGGDSSSNFLLIEGGLDGTLDTTLRSAGRRRHERRDRFGGPREPDHDARAERRGGAARRRISPAGLRHAHRPGRQRARRRRRRRRSRRLARTFTVDTVPPTNPTAIGSSTHVLGAWSPVTGFAVQWSGGTDDRVGLADTRWSSTATPRPPVDWTIEVADTAPVSDRATLGEGAWYVHVRRVDLAGNCAVGETETGFWGIDTTAPGAPGASRAEPRSGLDAGLRRDDRRRMGRRERRHVGRRELPLRLQRRPTASCSAARRQRRERELGGRRRYLVRARLRGGRGRQRRAGVDRRSVRGRHRGRRVSR